MSKDYKITLNDLDKKGGIERLRRDGFNNEDIHRALYKETDGATQRERERILNKLHERGR